MAPRRSPRLSNTRARPVGSPSFWKAWAALSVSPISTQMSGGLGECASGSELLGGGGQIARLAVDLGGLRVIACTEKQRCSHVGLAGLGVELSGAEVVVMGLAEPGSVVGILRAQQGDGALEVADGLEHAGGPEDVASLLQHGGGQLRLAGLGEERGLPGGVPELLFEIGGGAELAHLLERLHGGGRFTGHERALRKGLHVGRALRRARRCQPRGLPVAAGRTLPILLAFEEECGVDVIAPLLGVRCGIAYVDAAGGLAEARRVGPGVVVAALHLFDEGHDQKDEADGEQTLAAPLHDGVKAVVGLDELLEDRRGFMPRQRGVVQHAGLGNQEEDDCADDDQQTT